MAIALFVGYAGLAWITRLPGIGSGNDDAIYLFLAKSLLHGSYRDLYLPQAPVHVQYPPGWPLLLALPVAVLGEGSGALMLLPLLLSAGGLALLFDASRRLLAPVPALAALAIAVFNPIFITYGGRLKAEAAFFFFAALTIWAFAQPAPSRKRIALGAAAAIASAFMRSVGIAVIGAVLLHFLLARRWRGALIFALVAALTFGPWLGWSLLGPRQIAGRSYRADLVQVPQEQVGSRPEAQPTSRLEGMVYRAGRYLLGHLPAVMGFAQKSGTLVDNVGWLLLLLTAGLAGVAALWGPLRLVPLVAAGIFGVLFVWPWADRRFLHPLVPLVAVTLIAGAQWLGRRLSPRHGAAAGSLLVVALLVPGTGWRTRDLIRAGLACDHADPIATCYTPVERAYLEAAVAARAFPDTAVVLVQREAAFAFYSGRTGTYADLASSGSNADFLDFLRDHRVTHVLISRITRAEPVELARHLAENCRSLERIRSFGEGTELYRVLPRAVSDSSDTDACRAARERLAEAERADEEARRHPDVFRLPETEP